MSTGAFYEVGFTTTLYGARAIKALKLLAPRSIHESLDAQLHRLTSIHDSGTMPRLGVTPPYSWSLAVWSSPAPLRICMLVERTDAQLMSVAEGVLIEREAISRLGGTQRPQVTIRPRYVQDERLKQRIAENLSAQPRRHWSHGLT